jgi:hypothetical protein
LSLRTRVLHARVDLHLAAEKWDRPPRSLGIL